MVELCFDGVMGIQDKGTLSSKTLIFKLLSNLIFLVKLNNLDKKTICFKNLQIKKDQICMRIENKIKCKCKKDVEF